ncbi:histidine phosphatase family protein [Micromonospora radicis]|uniref:histidine phosphatase family protein n=1 Tax=Micromonospora radicis TaxID=1894971 RepID=UPI0013147A8B|nr:histidine phosphatase family protein [Micromonospora radicis]
MRSGRGDRSWSRIAGYRTTDGQPHRYPGRSFRGETGCPRSAQTCCERGARRDSRAYAEWRAPDYVFGLSLDDYPSEYRAWRSERLRYPDSALHGGESLTTLRQRAMEAVSRAHEAAQQGVPLIVSHRVFIGAVAA